MAKDSPLNEFHQPHVTPDKQHSFAIDDLGTAVMLSFHDGAQPVRLTGEDAKKLREWLSGCELRTQAEADALGKPN